MNKLQELNVTLSNRLLFLYKKMLKEIDSGVSIDTVRNTYKESFTKLLLDGMATSVLIGGGGDIAIKSIDALDSYFLYTNFSGVTLSESIHKITKTTVATVQHTIKMEIKNQTNWKTLSSKLIGKTKTVPQIRKNITKIYEYALKNNKNLLTISEKRELERRMKQLLKTIDGMALHGAPNKTLKNSYKKLINAVGAKNDERLKYALKNVYKRKIEYINQTIARTETARAYAQAFHTKINLDEDIVGWQWVLSDRHPRVDECDFYVNYNKGVYKKKCAVTTPAHPNCLCTMEPIYKSKNPPRGMQKSEAIQTLNRFTEKERGQIIGVGNSKFKTNWIDGLENKNVNFKNKTVKALPYRLIVKG